jgi:hypothetical protein
VKKLVAIDVVLRGRISRIHGCRNAVELKVVLLSKVIGGVGDGNGMITCMIVTSTFLVFGFRFSFQFSKQRAKKSDEKRSVSTYLLTSP